MYHIELKKEALLPRERLVDLKESVRLNPSK
ncbi:DNA repair protein RadC [Streptococcus agalactiae]|nr:DNA repair protein RadC [Streptococcus agalactiae]